MCLFYTIYQKTRVTGSYAKWWDHFSWMSCIRKLISDYKNAFCSRFMITKTLNFVMIDHLSQNPNPSCPSWVENVCIELLENWKLFSLFFLSYTLQCKVSALELENVSRKTSKTFFKHQFGIREPKSKICWVQIRIPPDGVRFADTLVGHGNRAPSI